MGEFKRLGNKTFSGDIQPFGWAQECICIIRIIRNNLIYNIPGIDNVLLSANDGLNVCL